MKGEIRYLIEEALGDLSLPRQEYWNVFFSKKEKAIEIAKKKYQDQVELFDLDYSDIKGEDENSISIAKRLVKGNKLEFINGYYIFVGRGILTNDSFISDDEDEGVSFLISRSGITTNQKEINEILDIFDQEFS